MCAVIAMEFIEGSPLDALIGDRGLPWQESLDYATQIAGALAAAHAAIRNSTAFSSCFNCAITQAPSEQTSRAPPPGGESPRCRICRRRPVPARILFHRPGRPACRAG